MDKKQPLKLTGTIIFIGDEMTGTNQGTGEIWRRRSFMIEIEDNGYKNTVGFQSWGPQAEAISRAKPGDTATVYFTPITRTHENKFFTELKAYGINFKFAIS